MTHQWKELFVLQANVIKPDKNTERHRGSNGILSLFFSVIAIDRRRKDRISSLILCHSFWTNFSFLSLGLSFKAYSHPSVPGRSKCISSFTKQGASTHLCCKVNKKLQLFQVSGGNLFCRCKPLCSQLGHMPLLQALGRKRQADLWVKGQG